MLFMPKSLLDPHRPKLDLHTSPFITFLKIPTKTHQDIL